MSAGIDAAVIILLNAKLAQFTYNTVNFVNAKLVGFEGDKIDPPADAATSWIEQFTLKAPPLLLGAMSGVYREQGIYKMNVVCPQGSGIIKGVQLADALCAHFPRGLTLTDGTVSVRVERTYRSTPVHEELWQRHPVSAEWMAYRAY